MGKVRVSYADVYVILRHDPNSSDIVDVAAVVEPAFLKSLGITIPKDGENEVLERWATQREIEFIRSETDEYSTQEQIDYAHNLTIENFTKQTDLWFEVMLMPVLATEAEA
jgi:hypothetical protein